MSATEAWPITVYLVDTVSGDERTYRPPFGWNPPDELGSGSEFLWAEGNYSCDCNRSRFLWDWDESKQLPCGDGRIRIRITLLDNGEELYSDLCLEDQP